MVYDENLVLWDSTGHEWSWLLCTTWHSHHIQMFYAWYYSNLLGIAALLSQSVVSTVLHLIPSNGSLQPAFHYLSCSVWLPIDTEFFPHTSITCSLNSLTTFCRLAQLRGPYGHPTSDGLRSIYQVCAEAFNKTWVFLMCDSSDALCQNLKPAESSSVSGRHAGTCRVAALCSNCLCNFLH